MILENLWKHYHFMNSSWNQKSRNARTPVCRSLDGWKKAPLMAVTMPYRKFQVTQVSSHSTTITTTSYTEPHTYKYLQKRHINLWDPRYTHIINHLQWLYDLFWFQYILAKYLRKINQLIVFFNSAASLWKYFNKYWSSSVGFENWNKLCQKEG